MSRSLYRLPGDACPPDSRQADDISSRTTNRAAPVQSALLVPVPTCIWLTGIPAAGKSTLAMTLQQLVQSKGVASCWLDGDDVRTGLNSNLGFSRPDRTESVRRVGHVARMLADSGLLAIASLISPFRADRSAVRELLKHGSFIEVFVDTPCTFVSAEIQKGIIAKRDAESWRISREFIRLMKLLYRLTSISPLTDRRLTKSLSICYAALVNWRHLLMLP